MLRRRPRATLELTRADLVLAPPPPRRRVLAAGAAVVLLMGMGLALLLPQAALLQDSAQERSRWQQAAEQQRMALELATARAQALEAQIDQLNQKLRECREELTFFRQAGEARR